MNDFQREIYKTIDILVNEKLKQLGFDTTKRGKVVLAGEEKCVIEIDGESYSCKVKKGIRVAQNDIVLVKFPQNNDMDKYVDEVVKGVGGYNFLEMLGHMNGSSMILDCGLPNSISNGMIMDGGDVSGI